MKASKFSQAQKAFILKQGADGMPVADICRKAGIGPATYFNWKKKYDGLLPTEMRRLKPQGQGRVRSPQRGPHRTAPIEGRRGRSPSERDPPLASSRGGEYSHGLYTDRTF